MRPQPRPDEDSQEFWDACARGELLGQNCGSCGLWRWPPREHCASCHAADPRWMAVPRQGEIAGAVVLHRPFDPAFADAIPLMIAQVIIDGTGGQFILTGNLTPVMAVEDAVGRRVNIDFRTSEGTTVPTFTWDETNERK